MTYDDFLNTVHREYREWQKVDSTYRYGQCMFNMLHALRPDLAEKIRTTPLDPFYKEYVSQDTWEYLQERW